MMPEGLFDRLSAAELRDLVGYLASPSQVPLPQPYDVPGQIMNPTPSIVYE